MNAEIEMKGSLPQIQALSTCSGGEEHSVSELRELNGGMYFSALCRGGRGDFHTILYGIIN